MVTEEMKNAADNGNVLAIVKCIKGYNESSLTWVEDFEDEDTHETVQIDRCESQVLIPTDEELDHINALEQILLKNFRDYVTSDLYLIVNNLESYINPVPFIEELVERGETRAMYLLGNCYYFGDEEHGIYRDSARARELYEQAAANGSEEAKEAIQQMTLSDDEEADINLIEYHITGSENDLDPIRQLIGILYEKIGYKDSPVGNMYIPYSVFMKVLIGSEEYTGNVTAFESKDDELIINAECDTHSIDALMYALYECFPDVEINMKEK